FEPEIGQMQTSIRWLNGGRDTRRPRAARARAGAGTSQPRSSSAEAGQGEGARIARSHRPQADGADARWRAHGGGRLPTKERDWTRPDRVRAYALQLQLLGR